MAKSEKQLYFALCWLANLKRNNHFTTTREDLINLTGIATKATTDKALRGLEDKALLSIEGTSGSPSVQIHLFDPYTGEPLQDQTASPEADPEDDPANYRVTTTNRRVILNSGNPEAVERLVRSCLPEGAQIVRQSNGGLTICCPFHQDDNPSCSVSPSKCCFNCFGCHEKGTLTKLLIKISGESHSTIIRKMVEANGVAVEFHLPDDHAEAIYSYNDREGNLVKQVLRYPGKRFSQRRLTSKGWAYNIAGARPLLYHADRLVHADTVAICEGEKDCDNLMALQLWGADGCELVSTTTGGSETWLDELANDLRDKRIIVMPDDDEAGARCANSIITSLESRGIEYRVVRFTDTRAKDVSDFLKQGHSKEDLVERIGADWVATSAPSPFDTPEVLEDA
jgi:5S rRNA maturation endonuclease (ribonuclease M5)